MLTFMIENNKKEIYRWENLAELYQKNHVRISVRDGIRVAPHMYNNMEDMEKLIQILKEFIK